MLNEFYQKLEEKYATGNPQEVENFLLDETKCHFLCCGKTDDVQVAVYNELGSFYMNQGKVLQAIDQFKAARDFVATLCGSESPEYATVVGNLADAYRLGDEDEKALQSYKEALGVYERTTGKDSYLYASALNNVALLYTKMKRFEEAERSLAGVLELTNEYAELKPEQAIALTNLATLYMCQGKNVEATEYLKQAIGVYASLPEECRIHLAAAYNTMGDLQVKQGERKAAKEAYISAKDLTKQFYGKNTEYAIACKKLAMLAKSDGEKQEAKEYVTEALDILKSLGLEEKEIYADTKKLADAIEA